MNTQQIIELTDNNILGTYPRFPVAFTSGKGATLRDADGKEYIDLASGLGVNSIGCANPAWINAVTEQAAKLAHVSNLYYTEPMARLAEQLTQRAGMSAVFFANSGAEANEGLIKLARKYSYEQFGSHNRHMILSLQNSFHGRTITALEATGQEKFHGYDFFPYTGGFKYVQPGSVDAVKAACSDGSVCAVLIELIQGEGGVYPLPKDYVQRLAEFCNENDILLLVDEVQTGIGRTGTLFAFQQYGIAPDAISFAKGIGGGLPLGGFLVSDKVRGILRTGDHGSTFGGNPICCAGALAVLNILSDVQLAEVTRKGEKIRRTILSWNSPHIAEIRGFGLMLGIELSGLSPRDTAAKLLEDGAVTLTAGTNTLRLLPPLTITDTELERGLGLIKQALR
ncbi:MAG: acetylornithine/succinylornithine family transaminase [Oscillospiraceae bacterium]|jgi:acetylornithine/N-succinyldiaminopimelate aminotransferase|nr:acetylornithine/succinylornithine family transaminase [Oscillospiraceae bacterium]